MERCRTVAVTKTQQRQPRTRASLHSLRRQMARDLYVFAITNVESLDGGWLPLVIYLEATCMISVLRMYSVVVQ